MPAQDGQYLLDHIIGDPPSDTVGSRLEWLVFYLLVRPPFLQLYQQDFFTQYSFFGGRQQLGGLVADFFFPAKNLVWLVQGEYYHSRTGTQRAQAYDQKQRLFSDGRNVVFLHELELLRRPAFVIRRALTGTEVGG